MIENQDQEAVDIGKIFEGRTILLSGSTGFVGKVALSMLLCKYPNIGKVYPLVRPGRSGTADERFFGKVIRSPAFDPVREQHGSEFEAWMREKCEPVAGDVTEANLGLADDVVGKMVGTVNVLINSAGMVDFTPPLGSSIKVNADGARNAAELAARIGAGLVHVSTCFTAGQRDGHVFEDLPIDGYYPRYPDLGRDFDAEAEAADCMRMVDEIKARANDRATTAMLRQNAREGLEAEGRNPDDEKQLKLATARERRSWITRQQIEVGMKRSQLWGWQNTYCYGKSLGDQRIAAYAKEHGLQFALAKPAVVESSIAFPFPGWNEGFTTCAPLMYLGIRGHRTFPVGKHMLLDVIPVDLVCAGILSIAAVTIEGRQEEVYQLCTGDSNPLEVERVIELTALARRQHYRKKTTGNRRINRLLSQIEPLPRSRAEYNRVSVPMVKRVTRTLRGLLDRVEPAWGAPRAERFVEQARDMLDEVDDFHEERGMMFELFMPFLTEANYTYRADRMHRLYARMTSADQEKLPWRPKDINWREYWLDTHINGLKKWVFPNLEEELENRGRRRVRPQRNLVELLGQAIERHGKRWALRKVVDKTEERYTYQEFGEFSDRAAAWLGKHAEVGPGDKVMLVSENRPEWPMTYFGILKTGGVAVPVDSASTAAEIANLAAASEAKALVLSDEVAEELGEELERALKDKGATPSIMALDGLFERLLPDMEVPRPRIKGDSIASLIFTSGTTGTPKGVMLSHRNFSSLVAKLQDVFKLRPTDGVLSVLPLHHTFEFTCGLLTPIAQGAEVTYLEELSADALSEALKGGRITAMIGVPALWQLLHRKIESRMDQLGPWGRELARGIMSLNRMLRKEFGVNLGKAVFAPVHRELGGMKFLVSGGSALSSDVMEAFQGLGFDMYEGYGLTESSPVLTVTRPSDRLDSGSVGKPLPGIEIRIKDPDDEGVGEVIARGPSVMQGYFGDEDASAQALVDGWLHTGDLGTLDDDGVLTIVGRAKDVIVDAGGKNIYPDELETLYTDFRYLDELCIVGLEDDDARGERVACIAVPDYEAGSEDGLSRDQVREQVRAHFREVSAAGPLYRRVKVLHLWDRKLPRTSTRKVKRPLVVTELQRLERMAKVARKDAPLAAGKEGVAVWISNIVASVAERDAGAIRDDQKLVDDLGLDSLGLTELASALEAAGVTLPEGVENDLQTATVASLAKLVAAAPRTRVRKETQLRATSDDLNIPALVATFGERLLRLGQRALYEQVYDVNVVGREHLPVQGSVLVATNHTSHLDMGIVKHALGEQGPRMSALAAKDYFFDTPIKRAYFENFTNVLPMERETGIRESLRLAGEALRRGRHLLIFPEGTRSVDGEIQAFLPSVGFLAMNNKVDVLPMFIGGTHEALPKGGDLPKRVPLIVRIGPALEYVVLRDLTQDLTRQERYRVVAAVVEDAVRAMGERRRRRPLEEIREQAVSGEEANGPDEADQLAEDASRPAEDPEA